MRPTITAGLRSSNFADLRSKTEFLNLLSCYYRQMKSSLNFFGPFSGIRRLHFVSAGTSSSDSTTQTEVYGTASDGTVLHWIVYQPSTPGPWPTVLVIHGGGFNAGSPDSSSESITCGQDLAAAGYIAFSIEYRLAPPGALHGQTSDGRFPDQSDDVKLAVRTARLDPRCNGQVGAVGGSAGGYEVAFYVATGTPGDDRLDFGVSLSGAYDLSDFSPNPHCHYYTATVTNYVNAPSTDTAADARGLAGLAGGFDNLALVHDQQLRGFHALFPTGRYDRAFGCLGGDKLSGSHFTGRFALLDHLAFSKDQALTFIADAFAGVPPPPPLPPPPPGSTSKQC